MTKFVDDLPLFPFHVEDHIIMHVLLVHARLQAAHNADDDRQVLSTWSSHDGATLHSTDAAFPLRNCLVLIFWPRLSPSPPLTFSSTTSRLLRHSYSLSFSISRKQLRHWRFKCIHIRKIWFQLILGFIFYEISVLTIPNHNYQNFIIIILHSFIVFMKHNIIFRINWNTFGLYMETGTKMLANIWDILLIFRDYFTFFS